MAVYYSLPDFTGTTINGVAGTNTTAGTSIPLSAGDRVVNGQLVWAGEYQANQGTPVATGADGTVQLPPGIANPYLDFASAATIDIAVAFGYALQPAGERGLIQISRIWAGAGQMRTLIYDSTQVPILQYPGLTWRFYNGDNNDSPDPIILAAEGQNALSYPNMIYVVFPAFPSGVFNPPGVVSVPPISVEFQDGDNSTNVDITDAGSTADTMLASTMFANWTTFQVYVPSDDGTTMTYHDFDLAAESEVSNVALAGAHGSSFNYLSAYLPAYDQDWNVALANLSPATNSGELGIWDIGSGALLGTWGVSSNDAQPLPSGGPYEQWITTNNMQVIKCTDSAGVHHGVILSSSIFGDTLMAPLEYTKDGEFPNGIPANSLIDLSVWEGLEFSPITTTNQPCIVAWNLVSQFNQLSQYAQAQPPQQDAVIAVGANSNVFLVYVGMRNGIMQVIGADRLFFDPFITVLGMVIDQDGSLVVFGQATLEAFEVQPVGTVLAFRYQNTYSTLNSYGTQRQFVGPITTPQSDPADPSEWGFIGIFPSLSPGNSVTAGSPTQTFAIIPSNFLPDSFIYACQNSDTSLGTFGYALSGEAYAVVNLGTLGVTTGTFAGPSFGNWLWCSSRSSFITPATPFGSPGSLGDLTSNLFEVQVDQFGGQSIMIGDAMRWCALWYGYDADLITVDASLIDTTIATNAMQGVLISKPYAFEQLCLDMGAFFNFTAYESDGGIKFVRNSETPVLTLTLDGDLAPVNESTAQGTESIVTTFEPPENLAAQVTIQYLDPAQAYVQNQQTYRVDYGIVSPIAAAGTATYSLPVVMPAATALAGAANIANRNEQMLSSQTIRTSSVNLALEPSDVITVTVNEFAYTVQLLEVTVNADWSMSFMARTVGTNNAPMVIEAGQLDGNPTVTTVPGYSDSRIFVADIPLLTPSQDGGPAVGILGIGAMAVAQVGWQGAVLQWQAPGSASFAPVGIVATEVSHGVVPTALGAGSPWHTDPGSMTVVLQTLHTADFASAADEADFLGGVNTALYGAAGRWEFLYFDAIAANSAGSVTLSGLIRGQRGTEWAMASHESGDTFALVSSASPTWNTLALTIQQIPVSDLGKSDAYKAIGITTRNAPVVEPETVFCNSLKPFAPVNITAAFSGSDIVLAWLRRDRLDAGHFWVTDNVSMSEQSLDFEMEILNHSGGTVLRTVTGLSSATYTYTSAQQATDSWAAGTGDTITVNVYQVSAAVGRGFAGSAVVDIH